MGANTEGIDDHDLPATEVVGSQITGDGEVPGSLVIRPGAGGSGSDASQPFKVVVGPSIGVDLYGERRIVDSLVGLPVDGEDQVPPYKRECRHQCEDAIEGVRATVRRVFVAGDLLRRWQARNQGSDSDVYGVAGAYLER